MQMHTASNMPGSGSKKVLTKIMDHSEASKLELLAQLKLSLGQAVPR